ncbi:MAG: AAA family ATPase [Mycobacterium sp.]
MKLHRLVLRNYRGIAHRDIEFPDRGVVVVSGANEIGKSSMIEAIDLLIEAKDRSTKKEVKQVKPTHVDEGAEITAEISTGPYRFEYHKRFHKRPETRLTVTAPRREQLTGDEAHDRVQAILAETVDTDLWRAQRVLQSASTAPVDLSGCDALARALDVSAGQVAALGALTGSEPLLIDRIDAEFREYFTATGRATGPWAAAVSRLREADDEVARCQAEVDEVDEAVARHATLTDELARVSLDRVGAGKRLERAQAAADTVKQLTDRLTAARAVAEGAAMTQAASDAALGERRRLRGELDERAATIEGLTSSAESTSRDEARAAADAASAAAATEVARAVLEERRVALDAARAVAELITRRDEANKLTAKLTRVEIVDRELADVTEELGRITLSEEVMRDVELAALATERAAAQAESASARVELDVVDHLRVLVAGRPVDVGPEASWSQNVTTPTNVEVPGLLTIRVVPGSPAADCQAKLDRARQMLAVLLEEAGVADVDAARALDLRRRGLMASRERLAATRDALLGDDALTELRVRLAELRSALHDALGDAVGDVTDAHPSAETAGAELTAARKAHRDARAAYDAQRDVATAASARAMAAAGQASVVRAKLTTAHGELAVAAERLARQRESITDDQLAIQAQADGERASQLVAQIAAVESELAAAHPSDVAVELKEATRLAADLGRRHDDVGGLLREVTAQLRVYGTEGRKGRLDAAQAVRERALGDHARMQRRAAAAQLLQSVMARHRDEARLRYVDPFRAEVERLGRIVFGGDFEVEVDGDLRMQSRTLAGRTVPYDSLSGGAKEQLGIVARLASAALVAKEDGVPVVIDDALGFSDANRLVKMAEVFDAVGGDGQVIVLTCSPERYAAIGDAHRIELTA